MTHMLRTYVDPLAMRNLDAERRTFGMEALQPRVSSQTNRDHGTIRWWVLQYETAGRALLRERV